MWAATQEPRLAITTCNLLKALAQHATQSVMMTKLGLPTCGNLTNRSRPQQCINGDDVTESELSVESRSFVNQVNDQVRKRQKRISNVTEDGEEHSMIWGMFMTVTMESAVFMGKNYLDNCQSIANRKNLTLKQMFDISTRLVSEQDETSGLETIGWENHSWNYLSLIGDERVINLRRTKVYVFSDSVLCLGKILENPPIERWPGGWGPQGMSLTGGGGLARVPNLRVCKHLLGGWHTQGEGLINILP